jgi:hypothetical protein
MRTQLFAVLSFLAFASISAAQDPPQSPAQQPLATDPVAASLPTPAQDPSGKYILPCETPIHLTFAQDFNGKKASIGDKLPLVLSDDVIAGNMLFAKKGAPVDATILELIPSRIGGSPGFVRFEVHSFVAGNAIVFVHGKITREGQVKAPGGVVLIPVVGPFTVLRHGTDATIRKGTPFTAFLSQDTLLAPLN